MCLRYFFNARAHATWLFLFFFSFLFYIWIKKLIKQIIELNWVHYPGSKFNRLIHDIQTVICFCLMLFLSLNFKKIIQFHILLSTFYFIYIYNSNLKECNFTFCCIYFPLLFRPHMPIMFFYFKKICCFIQKKKITHLIAV
jgi:hypothetical protein